MKLPPLRAVQYFESVARLNSFSKAAEALNVTQSAVSHQIKLLEAFLGESLLDRQGRSISLTARGQRYFEEIGEALASISRASQHIREGESGQLKLAMYSSLAVKWLMPHLGEIRKQHPEIDLTLEMFADEPDLSDKVADCFILSYQPDHNYRSDLLYHEQLYPVCSQKIWQQLEDKPLPEGLWEFPLISVQSSMADRSTGGDWHRWCELGGFSLPKTVKMHHFSHMLLASEAARYEQGITFLNYYFMNEIDRQELVRIPMHELPTGDSIYFVYKKNLGRWLKQICVSPE